MKTRNLLYPPAVVLLLAVSSCKKSDPVQAGTGNQPVFTYNGNINNQPVNFKAGVNNYYMFTSYAPDGNGVYDFTGEFRDVNCTSNCINALKITIKDYRQYSLAPTNIDSSVAPGYYSYASPAGTASKYYVTFNSMLLNDTAQKWTWDFGDGSPVTVITNTSSAVHQYSHPGVYTPTLTIQSKSYVNSTIYNDIVLGQTGDAFVALFSPTNSNNTFTISAVPSGNGIGPYSYIWNFGDGNMATGNPVTNTYTASGVYMSSATVTDSKGYTNTERFPIIVQPTSACGAFFYVATTYGSSNQMNLGNVTIEWRDAGGVLWTSANNSQPAGSMFRILSESNYLNNSGGQTTKKITAKVSCTLYNGTSSMPFTGDVIFAVAYH
ncbi:MAG TPA: PKD domain-containing protein [Bacteroidia bacterium]|jgi:PKD repeat protein|nr:PKD domain-containing protein [Bacteroidia bacterium]